MNEDVLHVFPGNEDEAGVLLEILIFIYLVAPS